MQVKKTEQGKPPKLRWGYKLAFPVLFALVTIGCTVGELYCRMHIGLILATFLLGAALTAFLLYTSEGYTLTEKAYSTAHCSARKSRLSPGKMSRRST